MLQDPGAQAPNRMRVGGIASTRVLIAHRDPAARHAMRRALDITGCVTAEAADAADVLHAAWRHRPEVLLLDAALDTGDGGTWLLRRIKTDPDLFGIAVVLVGGPETPAAALAALEQGAHDVLIGRLAGPELVARVRAARRSHDLQEQLLSRERALERLAYLDELTALPNRRYLLRQLDALLSRSRRHRREIAVLMVDIDHFKALNDRDGHHAGDLALRTVAERLAERVRREDVVGRIGGEEFAVVLPDTGPAGAAAVAEDLRAGIAERTVPVGTRDAEVTISVGWAVWEGEPLERLLTRADDALYAAKAAGRDRVAGAPAGTEKRFSRSPRSSSSG
jgi:diguanylate cyclase (GGDEF)-like protein